MKRVHPVVLNLIIVCLELLMISVQSITANVCKKVSKTSSQDDMMMRVLGQYYSVGYLSSDQVAKYQLIDKKPGSCTLSSASMINKMGTNIQATPESIKASVLVGPSSCPTQGLCADIIDTSASSGWPISFLAYLAIPSTIRDSSCATSTKFDSSCTLCLRQKTLLDYLLYILEDADAANVISDHNMAVLPTYLVARIRSELIPKLRCAGLDGNFTSAMDWPASQQAISLVGSGFSVQSDVQAAIANVFNIETSVSISFRLLPSSPSPLSQGIVDFEMRDFPQEASVAASNQALIVPVIAAAVVPVYHLDRPAPQLKFSRAALANLFLGRIGSWTELAPENPSAAEALKGTAPLRFVSGDDTGETGAPAAFLKAIRSFANLAAESGPDSTTPASMQIWPEIGGTPECIDRACTALVCSAGSFLEIDSNSCQLCPPGTYTIDPGSILCSPCPSGSYSGLAGARGCSKCDDVSYQPDTNSQACLPCPANTRRFRVASSGSNTTDGTKLSECLCLEGYWLPSSVNDSKAGGKPCQSCPEGAECKGFDGKRQTIPVPKINFFGDPAHPSEFFECHPGRCAGSYNCSEGFSGRYCSQPASGYWMLAGIPRRCESWSAGLAAGLTALEVLIWLGLVNLACSQYHSLWADMLMLQTSGYIAKLRLRWHPDMDIIRLVAELFNFELAYVGHECSSREGWTGPIIFYWQLSFPFLSVLLCAIWWLIKAAISRLRKQSTSPSERRVRVIKNPAAVGSAWHMSANFWDYLWTKFLMFFLTWYPVLVYTVFSALPCIDQTSDGESYLINFPEVRCRSDQHWTMIYVSCAYIPLVLLGIPAVLAQRLNRGLQADLLIRSSFMECYGWIYSKYKCEYAWWEMLVLVRRALICICAALIPVPMVAICLIIFILNVFLCAQLSCKPHMREEIRLLEVGSIFSCMIQGVAGILLYPSLDKVNECVGSTNLDILDGACDRNAAYKRAVTVVVLLIFSANLATSIALFVRQMYLNHMASNARKMVHEAQGFDYDEYDIQLSDVICDERIVALAKRRELQESFEEKERYRRLNDSIPYFIMLHHNQSGHYAQDQRARTLNSLLSAFPRLIHWLACTSDRGRGVAGLGAFVDDYAAYAAEHHSVAFGRIILTAHRADLLMWLTSCTQKDRFALCRLLLGVASAGGIPCYLRPGDVREALEQEDRSFKTAGSSFNNSKQDEHEKTPLLTIPMKPLPSIMTDQSGEESKFWRSSIEQARGDQRNLEALVHVIQTGPETLAAAAAELCTGHAEKGGEQETQYPLTTKISAF